MTLNLFLYIGIKCLGGQTAEFYRNRKGYFSLNVQMVCNSKNYIMDIVARWPGSCHDAHIFENSALHGRCENGEFGESVILGDSGYPLRNYLMTPLGNPTTFAEERYNHSHIRTRTVIERTFGIWKRRFPILSLGMRCKPTLVQEIIIATAVLHNIAVITRDEEVPALEDNLGDNDQIDDPAQPLQHIFNAVQQRYINYFQV